MGSVWGSAIGQYFLMTCGRYLFYILFTFSFIVFMFYFYEMLESVMFCNSLLWYEYKCEQAAVLHTLMIYMHWCCSPGCILQGAIIVLLPPKDIIHPNMKHLSSFTHPHVVPKLAFFCRTQNKIFCSPTIFVRTMKVSEVQNNIVICGLNIILRKVWYLIDTF